MAKNIFIIYAYPEESGFSHDYIRKYINGTEQNGNATRFMDLINIHFDPILRGGYDSTQTVESDLITAQENILWADHIVFFYPLWWAGMPALLRGFFERVFLPGIAFNFNKGGEVTRLLKGKSAHLFITMHNTPESYLESMGGAGETVVKKGILQFCGIDPVIITYIGPVYNTDDEDVAKWLNEAEILGKLV